MLDVNITMTPDSGDVLFIVRVAGTETYDRLLLTTEGSDANLMGDDPYCPVITKNTTYKTKKSTLIAWVYDWLDSQDKYDI